VIVTARRADPLEQLARERGSRVEALAGDIADPRHRQDLTGLVRAHGRLDVLVNNAGICDDGPLDEQSLDDLTRVVEVNLISVLDLAATVSGTAVAALAGHPAPPPPAARQCSP
jgi:short-subunit dehydrogenase